MVHEICSALHKYIEFLRLVPEHAGAGRAVVPPDGTVHELATNVSAFRFSQTISSV